MGRGTKRRFYFVKTEAKCAEPEVGTLLEEYLRRSLPSEESEAFGRHMEECLFCSAKVENLENIQAAMDYYQITREQTEADPEKAARQMNLRVVDLSGREMPRDESQSQRPFIQEILKLLVGARSKVTKKKILVGTADGLHRLDASCPVELAGHEVDSLLESGSGWWAITDGRQVRQARAPGVWKQVASVSDLTLNCLFPIPGGLFVGTSQAHLLRLQGNTLEPLPSFEEAEGRSEWYTPWGGPPEVRSISADPTGTVYVNVHVGGVVCSSDEGTTWKAAIDIDADVHQILFDAASGLLLAASAVGLALSEDGGSSWGFHRKRLHGSYLRAVAVAGKTILVTASTGPFTDHAAVYRRPLNRSAAFERCSQGLPARFSQNIDTFCLAASGSCVVFGIEEGSVYLSTDEGASWKSVAEGLPPVRCVALG